MILTSIDVIIYFLKVAAIFKIGHTKELPEMPQNLSDDGKDFIRQCLQRNPLNRPSAAQLLEHPFVKIAAPPERPTPCLEPSEIMASVEVSSLPSLKLCTTDFGERIKEQCIIKYFQLLYVQYVVDFFCEAKREPKGDTLPTYNICVCRY